MAGKAGQIIPRSERTWLVRVVMGRDSESGKRKYVNKTNHGTLRDAQAYLGRSQRIDFGVFFELSRMSLDGTSRCGLGCRRSLAGRTRV
jgi:hypothetical protein